MNLGQTVIIRTDLFGDNVGLISAQVAHIHMQALRHAVDRTLQSGHLEDLEGKENKMKDWLKQPYIFVKQVPNKEALEYFMGLAKEAGVEVNSWYDTAYVKLSPTQNKAFENILIGASLGPDDADKIRTVVGDLPLL